MVYTTQVRANYYDCDTENRLKISAAMKYMQQTSSEQLEVLGCSVEKLYDEGMVFLLSKMCIRIHRMPVCSEKLMVGTSPVTPRGARFVREFTMETPQGERLLSAMSLWLLVHPDSRKIVRPKHFPYALDFEPPRLETIIDDVPFPRAEAAGEPVLSVPVRYSQMDVNRHVNNTVYADFVYDALPYDELVGRGLETLVIGFQNEAKWGDVIDISMSACDDGAYHLTGLHGGAPCFEALAMLNKNK